MLKVYFMNMLGIKFGSYKKYPFISDIRKKKIESYKKEHDKLLSLGCELLLNRAIKDLDSNAKLPVEYSYDKNGRPYLVNLSYNISFSHSNNVSCFAISDDKVGIDIQFKKECNYEDLAFRYFPFQEAKRCINAEEFFKIWTLKEAYTKFLGLGMNKSFKSFMVDPDVEETEGLCRYYIQYKDEYKVCVVTSKHQEVKTFII